MIALVSFILIFLKALGINLSWGIVLAPLFIEIIYWGLEYIDYDSKMVDNLIKIRKKIGGKYDKFGIQ